MGVPEFETEYNRGKKIVDTMYQGIFEALVAFDNALVNPDNLVDFGKLADVTGRQTANDHLMAVLKNNAAAYFSSSLPAGADYKLEQMVTGLYGIAVDFLLPYLEKVQGKATSPQLLAHLTSENDVFKYMVNQNTRARPRSKLTLNDVGAVMNRIGSHNAAKVNPANIKSSSELAEILEQFLEEKALTESFLAGKNYKA